MNKKISFPVAVIIIIVLAVIVGGGILAYQYWWSQKPVACTMEAKVCPDGSAVGRIGPNCEFTPCPKAKVDQIADWKIYRSEKYGFEFRYPTTWKVVGDNLSFVQLQEVKDGEVVAIVGWIDIISKPISSPMDYPYTEMFVSNSRCPVAAGSRNLSSGDNYEENVYCLTGKEIQTSAGTWKGAVECSTSQWYGMKVDPSSCPHQFWIDTKDFFYAVHFNFFEPIKDNSDEAIFFDKFFKGFYFFTPSN